LRSYLKIVFRKGAALTGCGKTLYGHEDVSGHGFRRAEKLLKMNNTDLPKASRSAQNKRFSAICLSRAEKRNKIARAFSP